MNKEFKFIIGSVVALLLVACLLIWPKAQNGPPESDPTNTASSRAMAELGKTNSVHTNISRPAGAEAVGGQSAKHSDVMKLAAEQENVPISFWGKVVDQSGHALKGANVKISVRQWLAVAGDVDSKSIPFDRETRDDGTFEVLNAKGDVLEVNQIAKDGYDLSPKATMGFNFKRGGKSSPNEPVVYKMWRQGEKQPLVTHHFSRTGVPCDGTPVTFDLLGGQKNAGEVDLRVIFKRVPLEIPRRNVKYDWVATFEMIDGGLLESDDEFMRLAPEAGYRPVLKFEMSKDALDWKATLEKDLYFQARGGKYYGRLNIHLATFFQPPPTGLTMDIALNPSGSRNLESDPNNVNQPGQ